ncbi:hypothetical protein VCV18_005120 [Metarhizium anisopliae]
MEEQSYSSNDQTWDEAFVDQSGAEKPVDLESRARKYCGYKPEEEPSVDQSGAKSTTAELISHAWKYCGYNPNEELFDVPLIKVIFIIKETPSTKDVPLKKEVSILKDILLNQHLSILKNLLPNQNILKLNKMPIMQKVSITPDIYLVITRAICSYLGTGGPIVMADKEGNVTFESLRED